MRNLTFEDLKRIEANMDKYYALATKEDIESGLAWYENAYFICKNLASKYNTELNVVASIISALSPRNKWPQNIKDAETVLRAIHAGQAPEDFKVCTFNRNKLKAYLIGKKQTAITNKSLKTFSFVNNIANLDDQYVTIDVWHLRACFSKTITSKINTTVYDQIRVSTINKAKEQGLKGYEYQAILWNAVKNNF